MQLFKHLATKWKLKMGLQISKFKFHKISRTFYNRFYEEININHTLLWFSQASYMRIKTLDYIRGALK